jgi:hypothetical protein
MHAKILSAIGSYMLCAILAAPVLAATSNPQSEPMLTQSDLIYEGSFQLPNGSTNQTSFAYAGNGLAYDAADNSLFITGHSWYQYTAEISIPTPVQAQSISSLPTATILQPLTDALDGNINAIAPTDPASKSIGGYLVYNGKLIISAVDFYDATGAQSTSHFVRSLTLSAQNTLQGPFRVGTQYPGFVSGYMTLIPPEWQTLFGGPALTGNCCLNIISVQSNGPAASVFDPSQLGSQTITPATPVVGYPYAEKLSAWASTGNVFNGTTQISGIAFPEGTSSVLFFGRQGTGTFCYGPGTSNPSQAGQPADNGVDQWCYDPTSGAKGGHAYPYFYQVWEYSANDLLKVKQGTEPEYSVQPSSIWQLHLPFTTAATPISIGGAAYNPATNTIYLLQQCVGAGCTPVVDVFKVTIPSGASSTNTKIPSTPINVSVQ